MENNNANADMNRNNLSEDDKVDININGSFEHKIDYLTKEDIDYLIKNKLCFRIYSSERIEKKGKTTFIEVLRSIKSLERSESEDDINKAKNDGAAINGKKDDCIIF